MLLATDLDGTLLGGRQSDRMRLYRLITERDDIRVVWMTGRGLESVLPILSDPTVPTPDYVIADVGATVVGGGDQASVQPLQSQIAQRWPGAHAVLEALEGLGLQRQEVPQERRCSFYLDDHTVLSEVEDRVAVLGCHALYSAGKYLDILPKGVDKGATLRALVEHLGISDNDVLVAGDTLNDLGMFEAGYRAVAVGKSEAGLLAATRSMDNAYHANAAGAGGIIEALMHFQMLPKGAEEELAEEVDTGDAQLLMVYHRLPFAEVVVDGKLQFERHKSPNGIIPTLLGFFAAGRTGAWVAWSQQEERDPSGFEAHLAIDEEKYPNLIASRVALTADDVNKFYKVFSKEAFWPLLHNFIDKAVFREELWEHYCEVNRIFAERTAQDADDGALVWIHDYNLWMVPAYLRSLRPDLRISFFHHTPFPPPDVFNVIPWRREIVSSLLQCDYVGFHIPRYVENFVDVARSTAPVKVLEREAAAPRFLTYGCALGVDETTRTLEANGRTVELGAHPVGIDVERIDTLLRSDKVQSDIAALERDLREAKVILSIERLDYTKGPLAKLESFERLLEEHPELHGKVVLVTVCTPPQKGMAVYEELQTEVERAVGAINGQFSRLDWTPVRYFFRSFPFEQVVAQYVAADVAWITPLRDGLNLVAKEYVAAKGLTGTDGVLVLSEFAGAAVELQGAILTSPYDARGMVESLHRALTMPDMERRNRMRRLFNIVKAYDIDAWGEDFLAAASGQTERAKEMAQWRLSGVRRRIQEIDNELPVAPAPL